MAGLLGAVLIALVNRAFAQKLAAQERALAETRRSRDRSRRFLADVTHQIRSPIAGIQAAAETLLRQSPAGDSEGQVLLTGLVRETSRVGRLVVDLLQAARLDEGLHLDLEPCDVAAVCYHEVERVKEREPALRITVDAVGWDSPWPALDTGAVHDMVGNLLENARRHARSRIEVTVRRKSGLVEVRVADDGPGLPGEAAERVFERFVSLDGHGGSGLGLPIARELARAHGGDVRYHDGAFLVTLPTGGPSGRSRGPARTGGGAPAPGRHPGPRSG